MGVVLLSLMRSPSPGSRFFLRSPQEKFAAEYTELCRQTDDNGHGGLRFETDKHRLSFCVTAPQSQVPRDAASQQTKANGLIAKRIPAE